MARRRLKMLDMLAAVSLVAGAPLFAQTTPTVQQPSTRPPAPAPAPAPAGNVVGPPQLRDFNLNVPVTRPPLAGPAPNATPAPGATTPPPAATRPAATTPRATAPATTGSPASRATPLPAPTPAPPRQPTTAAPDSDPSPAAVTVDLPAPSATTIIPDAGFAPTVPSAAAAPPGIADGAGLGWWPWFAAALALALGAGFLMWRRGQQSGTARYATDHADLGALVATPDAAAPTPAPAPAARQPAPARTPSALPDTRERFAPPRAASRTPAPQAPAPRPSAPAPNPSPSPTPIAAPAALGIVASGLKPRIEFELVPIRAETDADGGAAVTFDVIVYNRGSAPARDVLVEAQLINAGPRVDEEVGRFFMQAAGTGERVPTIPPMGRVSIRSRLAVAGAALSPLMIEGRSLLVPLIAINAFYRWSGGELENSSSFLVGRGEGDDGKLAPFRLDRGARSWSGLAARLHSTGLQQA